MRFLHCLVITFALTSLLPLASADEDQIVQRLFSQITPGQVDFVPVSPDIIAEKRAWLHRTAERLEEFIADPPKLPIDALLGDALPAEDVAAATEFLMPDVSEWHHMFRVGELWWQLGLAYPDPDVLLDIHNAYLPVERDMESNERMRPEDQGYHVVASVGRALREYAVLLQDSRAPGAAQERVDQELTRIKEGLQDYRTLLSEQASNAALQSKIREIHHSVEELELRRQAETQTTNLRRHYIRPRARVFVATELLSELIKDLPLGSTPVAQCQNRTFVSGRATPTGRVQFQTFPNDEYGSLAGVYRGPVIFRGTAQRRRLCIGLTVNTAVCLEKRVRIIQGAPDSERATSQANFISADSSRGRLVDAVVTKSARQNFTGNSMTAAVRERIDDAVTAAANFINLQGAKNLRKLLNPKGIVRVRQYRTQDTGIELTLLSSRGGFKDATERVDPPDPFADPSQPDFSLSLHDSVPNAIARISRDRQFATSLRSVVDWLEERFDFAVQPLAGDSEVMLWLPQDEQLMFISDGAATLNFMASLGEGGQEFSGYFAFRPRVLEGGGSMLDPLADANEPFCLHINGQDNDARRIETELRERFGFARQIDSLWLPRMTEMGMGNEVIWESELRKISLSLKAERQY